MELMQGKLVAQKIKDEIYDEVKLLKPCLAVILVGSDPASEIYVRKKKEACQEIGITTKSIYLHDQSTTKDLVFHINNLNNDDSVHGILVQLPLPEQIDKFIVFDSISPSKDVDCFHSINIGKLSKGVGKLKPCTPSGILEMLEYYEIPTKGKNVTIINNSQIIGKPLAMMLSKESTVTVCHECTEDLEFHIRNADIAITAVGKYPKFIFPANVIKEGSTIIDVAVNRIDGKVYGDLLDFDEAAKKAKFISKMPGGVGLCTVACLLKNTLIAAKGEI